jgi:hypothetical protein
MATRARPLALDVRPLIGMVHLAPLPGAPRFRGDLERVVDLALADGEALARAGLDAILVENYGDVPFAKGRVEPETATSMAVVVDRLRRSTALPVGVNVLRNDAITALAVAVSAGASFIRVNVLAWARLTDQGLVEGQASELQRRRAALGADDVLVLADAAVKHSAALADLPIAAEAQDLVERALADAVVVTGAATGSPVDHRDLDAVRAAVSAPVLVGSGVTPASAPELRARSAGAIVGSALMEGGRPGGPVSLDRAARLVAAWKGA